MRDITMKKFSFCHQDFTKPIRIFYAFYVSFHIHMLSTHSYILTNNAIFFMVSILYRVVSNAIVLT